MSQIPSMYLSKCTPPACGFESVGHLSWHLRIFLCTKSVGSDKFLYHFSAAVNMERMPMPILGPLCVHLLKKIFGLRTVKDRVGNNEIFRLSISS